MDDRSLIQNVMLLQKGVCNLFMHGTIESSTSNVQKTFNDALNQSISMQNTIYDKMEQKGWYSTEQVDNQKVSSVKQKFNNW